MMATEDEKDFEDQIERMKLKNQQIMAKFMASEEDRRWAENSGSVINKSQNIQIKTKVKEQPKLRNNNKNNKQRPKSFHGNMFDDEQYNEPNQSKENQKSNRYRNYDDMAYQDFKQFQQSYQVRNTNPKWSNYTSLSYDYEDKNSNRNRLQLYEKKFLQSQRKNSTPNEYHQQTLSYRFSKDNNRHNGSNYQNYDADYSYAQNGNYNGYKQNNNNNSYNNTNNNNNYTNTNNNNSYNNTNNNSYNNTNNNTNYNNKKNKRKKSKSRKNNTKPNDEDENKNPQISSESKFINKNYKKNENSYKNGYDNNNYNNHNHNQESGLDDEYIDDTLEDLEQYRLKVNFDDFIVIDPESPDPILIKPLKPWSKDHDDDHLLLGNIDHNTVDENEDLKGSSELLSTVKERAKDYLSLGNHMNNLSCSDYEETNGKTNNNNDTNIGLERTKLSDIKLDPNSTIVLTTPIADTKQEAVTSSDKLVSTKKHSENDIEISKSPETNNSDEKNKEKSALE